jgi:hypothetical protein
MNDDTARTSRHVLLEEMLTTIVDTVRAQSASPFTRELVAEAERYQRVIAGWAHQRPIDSQCAAMYDCVLELRARVAREATGPFTPRIAPLPSDVPGSRRRASK